MSRSLLRPDQLDAAGSYSFAQLVIDGYSGGDLQDGYLTGLVLETPAGVDTLRLHADNGEIEQIGTGPVTLAGNVHALQDVVIDGSLTVQGTTTTIDTDQMIVSDPITIINAGGLESLSSWTGFSGRDVDGYNQFGWVFQETFADGYWALSPSFSPDAQPDAVPERAVAYIGAGDSYGDLSSIENGDSGASKVGTSTTGGITSTDVQAALEELQAEINSITVGTSNNSGTSNPSWHINTDALPGSDEDPCLIMGGGDGTSLMEGYLCLITDAVGGTRFEFRTYDDSADYDRVVHLGPDGSVADVDACVVLNAGDGVSATSASLCLDGTENRVELVGPSFFIDGYTVFNDRVEVQGALDAYGDVTLGTGPEDCIIFNGVICSDIVPCCDDAYDIGSPTKRFNDGYFTNLNATNFTLDNNLTIDGDVTLGTGPEDCIIFNGVICSDIIPCCDDAYDIGSPSKTFNDGYFTNLDTTNLAATTVDATTVNATTVGATTVNATTVNATDVVTTGDVSVGNDLTVTGLTTFDGCVVFNDNICSDILPCCDDAYSIGDSTKRWHDGYFTNFVVSSILDAYGDVNLGSGTEDCVVFNALVCSDILPENGLHQLGDTTHLWLDAYFDMPVFTNITPVGSDDSLLGVLKGIDDALTDATVDHPRGVYVITLAEAVADVLSTTRTPNQGDTVDTGAVDITDAIFRDNLFIYWNGQLLFNDPTAATTAGSGGDVVNDVARQTGSLSNLLFASNLRINAIIQVVDMR